MKTIHTLGPAFVKRHSWLLTMTRVCGVAICGGCAAAIGKAREDYDAKDLDLVATKENALLFIGKINGFLLEKSVHFRIYANSRNSFVPKPALSHFRITCPFWVPVCLFVLPDDQFRAYRIKGRYLLQIPRDIKQAADDLTEVDAKPRLASEHTEEPEPAPEQEPEETLPEEVTESMGEPPLSFHIPEDDTPENMRVGSGATK